MLMLCSTSEVCLYVLVLLHYWASMLDIAGANSSTANYYISLHPCYTHGFPLPPLQRMAFLDSDWTACTSMYSTETFLAKTSHTQHGRNTIQEFLTTCPSTIKHLYFLPSCVTQLIICHNQSILMQSPWHLHIISFQNTSHSFTRFLRAYAKTKSPFPIKFVTLSPSRRWKGSRKLCQNNHIT